MVQSVLRTTTFLIINWCCPLWGGAGRPFGLGTLLGPEATGLFSPLVWGGCVVAPSWWWGVVFVL
ncbi:MAG: hypothetical protein E6Q54_01305 [Mycolicibacter arupensis]|uniref:Uncharacterized protein n=1 Tax=Mycolicibacter arupensis TaxID=342002 RepID=A0A5C7YF47_9MYCO|nr:MAG: hypothetical protein E6Q54_01305 [Mycolicibacter arupensis]